MDRRLDSLPGTGQGANLHGTHGLIGYPTDDRGCRIGKGENSTHRPLAILAFLPLVETTLRP